VDRLELEALAERMVDQVQLEGYAVAHEVTDPPFLRDLLRSQARGRSLRIRTGVAADAVTTDWACRPDADFDFAHPRTEADRRAATEAIDDLLT
jgi:hypothetical protein